MLSHYKSNSFNWMEGSVSSLLSAIEKTQIKAGFSRKSWRLESAGFCRGQVELGLFFDDGHEDIHGDRHPHLGFDRVFRSAEERADMKMLLDPAKEQFHFPAGAIEVGNGERGSKKLLVRKIRRKSFSASK